MFVKEISIRNFRILSNSTMDLNKNICLMIGRNNTGKTSFMILFDKFLNQLSFDFDLVEKPVIQVVEESKEKLCKVKI